MPQTIVASLPPEAGDEYGLPLPWVSLRDRIAQASPILESIYSSAVCKIAHFTVIFCETLSRASRVALLRARVHQDVLQPSHVTAPRYPLANHPSLAACPGEIRKEDSG